MGLAGSKSLLEASRTSSPVSTPTSFRSHHIFAVDPRSPSEEFARTPIAIEDDSFDAASQFSATELDPRSPAVGFQRTPMPNNPGATAAVMDDPRSPTTEVPRTPLEKISYSYSEDEEEQSENEIDLVLEPVPVKHRSSTPNFTIAEDPLDSSISSQQQSFIIKTAKLNLRNNLNDSTYNDCNNGGESPRSPLAISNRPNSLRIRVQHKLHASKVAAINNNSINNNHLVNNKIPTNNQMRQFTFSNNSNNNNMLGETIDKENIVH